MSLFHMPRRGLLAAVLPAAVVLGAVSPGLPGGSPAAVAADPKPEHPDRIPQEGVPRGTITSGTFTAPSAADASVFPGTVREYKVYVPAQYRAETPACLMVFQDGGGYENPKGAFRVPVVFDNLIHRGEMPVTVAVFVAPGRVPAARANAQAWNNRSFEYDSLGDRYARFLVDEFLPVTLRGLSISPDPKRRAIGGISSGGICAFTVAWERPDQFGRVMSHIGSFTNIRGGWAYPGLVRKTKGSPKPLKIWLQDGRDDLDNLHGNWPLANEDMAAALRFSGYDQRFTMTDGGHSGGPGGEIMPEALKWLWADDRAEPAPAPAAASADVAAWEPHPDAVAKPDVPKGTVEQMPPWKSQVFPGTVRDWAVYVPARQPADAAFNVMVFQDGHDYRNPQGRYRVPIVFDNLIARGDMPPTIAVFLDPGHEEAREKPRSPWQNSNRSFEYDSLGDRYARFLLDEILPEVAKRWPLSADPARRAICGASSGGICAFTAAWERPDQFGRAMSHIGSFTNIRGGDVYPSLVRKTEPKPLRVYLEDASGDVDNEFGSWPLANRQMAAALASMGYDTRFDWAEGFGHDSRHGSRLFPDAVRWLWRAEEQRPPVDTSGNLKGDMTLMRLLVPGAGWETVAEGLGFADAPCTDAEGNFFVCDMKAGEVLRFAAADGGRSVVARVAVSGLEFGPGGLLYGCEGKAKRVVSIDPRTGAVTEVAAGIAANDLAVTPDGFVYVTETGPRSVRRIELAGGRVTEAAAGLAGPNGIALSPDGGTLAVSEYQGQHVWTFRVLPGGGLDAGMPTMTLRRPIDPAGEFKRHEPPPYAAAAKGDGMAVDREGRYYVTSGVGVQVFDPTGRLCGVLPAPRPGRPLTSCILAGPRHDQLYVTNGEAVFRRRLAIAEGNP
jgi:enterochelin esterase-like enzyme/sugar lactone lactonase YvrE